MTAQQNTTLAKIFNIVTSIQDNLVTKKEFNEFKSNIYSHIDDFIKLHETLDTELFAPRHKYDRLDKRPGKIETNVSLSG